MSGVQGTDAWFELVADRLSAVGLGGLTTSEAVNRDPEVAVPVLCDVLDALRTGGIQLHAYVISCIAIALGGQRSRRVFDACRSALTELDRGEVLAFTGRRAKEAGKDSSPGRHAREWASMQSYLAGVVSRGFQPKRAGDVERIDRLLRDERVELIARQYLAYLLVRRARRWNGDIVGVVDAWFVRLGSLEFDLRA